MAWELERKLITIEKEFTIVDLEHLVIVLLF